MSLRRRLALLAAAGALTVPLAACGNNEVHFAETEGAYLTVKNLDYQVQISRQLNPHDVEDHTYLLGIPQQYQGLKASQSWFAVFLRVTNETDRAHPAAVDFVMRDTQGHVYHPIPIRAQQNPFAYNGGMVPPEGVLPLADSAPYNSPSIDGALILFKIDNSSFENRPLEFTILSPTVPQTAAAVNLDV